MQQNSNSIAPTYHSHTISAYCSLQPPLSSYSHNSKSSCCFLNSSCRNMTQPRRYHAQHTPMTQTSNLNLPQQPATQSSLAALQRHCLRLHLKSSSNRHSNCPNS